MLPAPETWQSAATFVALGGGVRRFPGPHRAAASGSLEQNPHNLIHGVVGGDMGGFQSPLDPLFWIHHCNIDRLWEVWLAQPGRQNPDQRSWLRSTFDFPDPAGRQSWTCGEVASTAATGYKYDDLSLPGSGPESLATIEGVDDAAPPTRRDDRLELVAASSERGSVDDTVQLSTQQIAFNGFEEGVRTSPPPLYLRLENVGIDSGDASSMWNVYLQVGNRGKHIVGTIAPFGLAGLTHSGGRQTLTFDISHLAGEFAAEAAGETEVTFESVYDETVHKPFWDRVALYTTAE